jgi:glutathione peroxidase
MKYIPLTLILLLALFSLDCFRTAEKPPQTKSSKSLYDYSFRSIKGDKVNLESFKGKKILIVNVASECGFTPQYKDLEKLHRQYGEKVAVIGFPANNFMGQEPGTNEEIAEFCKTNYNVTFLMAEKISVKGDDIHPIYKWMTDKSLNGWNDMGPEWNFYKYLIDEKGELIKIFPSTTEPLSEDIISLL